MPFIFQDGALEAEEVQESIQQIVSELNQAYNQHDAFVVMTSTLDDEPVILQVDTIIKIKVSP